VQIENFDESIDSLPEWSFDGSSTNQAEGGSSDCILKPVRLYKDPMRENGYVVLCEVLNADHTPHETNRRATIADDDLAADFWFGFEQEYILMNDNGRPIGFPSGGYPEPQGPYYCAVGYHHVSGRDFIEEHMEVCLEAGVGIVGINSEVMLGQWEYQIFGENTKRACDDLIMSRYFLYRIAEAYEYIVNLDPKPIKGDWNGSGMHANWSTSQTRDVGGEEYISKLLEGFRPYHKEHLAEYGAHNEERLTGGHETGSYDTFSFGVSDRGASIRIPIFTIEHDWKGYIEDRRPASNADPYRVTSRILKTYKEAHENAMKQVD
jgi:glutamine synthetase